MQESKTLKFLYAQKTYKRNSNIEYFRFFLMIAICFLHLIVHGYGVSCLRDGILPDDHMHSFFVLPFLVPAVNCFMLVSGYYGMKLSFEKIARLSFLAFSIFCLVMIISRFLGVQTYSLSTKFFLMHLFPISTKVWWFLTEYVCVMLLSPFINTGINLLTKKRFGTILLFLLMINSLGLFINRQSLGSNFISLLLIYMIGRYIKMYMIVPSVKKSIFCYLLCVALLELTLFFLLDSKCLEWAWFSLSYNNPIVIAQSISLLFVILKIPKRESRIGCFLGTHCFVIYLFMEKWGRILYEYWASLLEESFLSFCLSFIAVIVFSLLLSCFLLRVFDFIKIKQRFF